MSKQDIVDAHQLDDEIAICCEIVKTSQFKTVRELFDPHKHREVVDVQSAAVIVAVYDRLRPDDQKKFAMLPVRNKGPLAWRLGK